MRTRSYDAHLTQKDIDKLRDLVETGISEKPTDTGNAGIVLGSPTGISKVVDVHGPELIAPKGLAKKAHSLLTEEDRSFRIELDQQKDDRE
jgi:hypothetical protein